jgi:hypothetical protein
MAVISRRRHQGGEAFEQLESGRAQRSVPARTGLGALIEQAFGIESAPPLLGERRPGAVAQQALALGAVSGLDADPCQLSRRGLRIRYPTWTGTIG